MRVQLTTLMGVAVGIACVAGLIQSVSSYAVKSDKVTICHRTDSVTNPYVVETVSDSSTKGGQLDDHEHHTGPVAISQAYAQQLKDNHMKWGDIIPPVDGNPGLNWTKDGKAIYNNGCAYVTTPVGEAVLKATPACVENSDGVVVVRVAMSNTGTASGTIIVNGVSYTLAAGASTHVDVAVNTKVTIVINDQTTYNNVVECGEGDHVANVQYDLTCDVANFNAVITFTNSGDADGTATLNGTVVNVPVGVDTIKTVSTGENGAQVTIMIDGKTVFNQLVTCAPGKGSIGGGTGGSGGNTTTTTATTTPNQPSPKSLPNTAGDSQLPSLISLGGVSVVAVIAAIVRRRFSLDF